MGIFQSVKNLVGSAEKENEMRLLRESRIVELRNKKLDNDILKSQIIDQFQNDHPELQSKWDKAFWARGYYVETIEQETDLSRVEETEGDLLSLCEREHLTRPEIAKENIQHEKQIDMLYFEQEIFGENSADEKKRDEMIKKMEKLVEKAKDYFTELDPSKVKFITRKDDEFELYFQNVAFRGEATRWQTVAILDDRTPNNDDFLFTIDGLVVVSQNKESGQFGYDEVTYKNDSHGNDILLIGDKYEFSNSKFMFMFNMNIDIKALKKLIDDIKKLS